MKLKIVQYPHPALVHATRPVGRIDKQLQIHVGEMIDAMYEAHGLGLAANQVALPYQLLVTNLTGDANQRDQEEVYINPVIVDRKGVQDGDEGCLSFPDLFQKVRRAKTVKVQAYNLKGESGRDDGQRPGGPLLAARDRPPERRACSSTRWGRSPGWPAAAPLKEFEHEFREAQERGEIPPDAEIEKILKCWTTRPTELTASRLRSCRVTVQAHPAASQPVAVLIGGN